MRPNQTLAFLKQNQIALGIWIEFHSSLLVGQGKGAFNGWIYFYRNRI